MLHVQQSGNACKDLVKKRVICTWETTRKDSALTKSSLHFLNLQQTSLEQPHLVWESALGNACDVDKAIIKPDHYGDLQSSWQESTL